jgi:hypothetical protein
MSENTIDSGTNGKAPQAAPKQTRKAAKKFRAAKKAPRDKKAGKPKADRANKKAAVIAVMKRPKGIRLKLKNSAPARTQPLRHNYNFVRNAFTQATPLSWTLLCYSPTSHLQIRKSRNVEIHFHATKLRQTKTVTKVPPSIISNLKPKLLGASFICMRIIFLDCGAPGFCMGQQDVGPTNARLNLSGTWQQNNERCIPKPRNKAHSYKMTVGASDKALRVRVIGNNGHGERKLDLNYEIGGKELVYTGIDGDEYHSKVQGWGPTGFRNRRTRAWPADSFSGDLDADPFWQESATSEGESGRRI